LLRCPNEFITKALKSDKTKSVKGAKRRSEPFTLLALSDTPCEGDELIGASMAAA